MQKLTLAELIIAIAMSGESVKPTVTGNSEMTLMTSEGVGYVFDVQLSPEATLTPKED